MRLAPWAVAAAVMLLLPPQDAEARRHCARGQIYRVSLGTCQAKAGFRPVARQRARPERRHAAKRAPRPVEPDPPEPLVPVSMAQDCRPTPAEAEPWAPWGWPDRWVYDAGLAHPRWALRD